MSRRRWPKILLATPIALGAALLGYPSAVTSSKSSSSSEAPTPHSLVTALGELALGSPAQAAGKRKSSGKARSAGRKAAGKSGGAGRARKAAAGKAAARAGKHNTPSGGAARKPVRHRRLAEPGTTHTAPSSNANPNPNNEMLSPVEPERAGPVPIESAHPAPRRVVHATAEDVPLSPAERELSEGLSLIVTPGGPYEPWSVQLQNTGDKVARISSDVRLLWFEATVPGKRKPVVCELPSGLRPKTAYIEERVELQPRQELSFNIDPRFFCFESEDTTLLVPGTFLKPHYGWRTKTQRSWQQGKPKEIRLPQDAPFVALSPGNAGGLKELLGAGIALDDRFAEWSKTRITQEDKLPIPLEDTAAEGDDESAGPAMLKANSAQNAAASSQANAATAPPAAGLELLMVRGSDAASATDISVVVAVRNRGTEPKRVFLRADQLTFIVWGPDGQTQCAPAFAYRAPDQQGLTRLAPGKRISMTVRLNELCPTGTFGRPGFYYVSADLPVLDNHDDSGEPLPRNDDSSQAPHVLEASFGRPLRVGSGDVRFNYWDVGVALDPNSEDDFETEAVEDTEPPHSPETHSKSHRTQGLSRRD